MRRSILSMLSLAALALPSAAIADTVTVDSTAGVTTYSSNVTGPFTGTTVAFQYPTYAAPIGTSHYVSTDVGGGTGAVGSYYYSNDFALASGESYSGSLTFLVDNYAAVFVNGVTILPLDYASNFTSATTIALSSSDFMSGMNTITFQDYNAGGPAALDFELSLTGNAVSTVTPEPSSLILLATGVLSAAGAARRRLIA